MSYINLASGTKRNRAAQISIDIGSGGTLQIFTGSPPVSVDTAASGTLLCSLPLSSPAGVASYAVQSATIVAAGSGGSSGAQSVTGTTGVGTKFQAAVTVAGGAITSINGISIPGAYSVPPTTLTSEPVVGGSLSGAVLSLVLTGQLTFNPITQANAVASGTAGYARIATSGGVGIIDLDCGTSAASVIMNTLAIVQSGPIMCSADILTEN